MLCGSCVDACPSGA
ncbi:MAG: 4Fe-4S binding protein [Spirochaetia bacterium]|nr:4Fe-4S binding protein [Spirochaetia bacterium]